MGTEGLLIRSIMIRSFPDEAPTGEIVDFGINFGMSHRDQSRFTIVRIVEQRPVIRQRQIELKQAFDTSRPSLANRRFRHVMAPASDTSGHSRDRQIG
jgi:hypothetical protein